MTKRRQARPDGADTTLVYSTEGGRRCRNCGLTTTRCRCRIKPAAKPGLRDDKVRIRREVRGRRGKTITTISGLPLDTAQLADLASELKRLCGSGGSVKDGVIEIQGDHRQKLFEALAQRGHPAILAGG